MSTIAEVAGLLGAGRKLALVHENADLDALGSAYAIAECFPTAIIWAPGGLDSHAKRLAAHLGMEVHEERPSGEFDLVLILDTSEPAMLPDVPDVAGRRVVIDHHVASDAWGDAVYLSMPERGSTAEIVWGIVQEAGKELSAKAALALLTGILADTGNFRYGDIESMRTFMAIVDSSGVGLGDVYSFLDGGEVDMSQRIAQLKGAQRLRFVQHRKSIIAVSSTSAFESNVAKALISLGSDVAIVGSQRKEEYRITGRARRSLLGDGLNLGQLFKEIGSELGGTGGGHPGAAGLRGTGDVEAMLGICLERVKEHLD